MEVFYQLNLITAIVTVNRKSSQNPLATIKQYNISTTKENKGIIFMVSKLYLKLLLGITSIL